MSKRFRSCRANSPLPVARARQLLPQLSKATTLMAESFNLADLVHGVSQGSMSTKMATPRLPLENPVKESERRKREKDIAKMAKQRMKAERKRRRSGRKVTPELLTNVNKKKALSGKALIRGHVRLVSFSLGCFVEAQRYHVIAMSSLSRYTNSGLATFQSYSIFPCETLLRLPKYPEEKTITL